MPTASGTENFVVEVRKVKAGTPYVYIFQVKITGPSSTSVGDWPETLATMELLQKFLLGLRVILTMSGYVADSLEWDLPVGSYGPVGKRWTIGRHTYTAEAIDAAGEVIRT